jgi:hypothetical protein
LLRFAPLRLHRLGRRAAGCELRHRHQHILHFAALVARYTLTAMAKQPHELAHRLARLLVGNPMHDYNGNAAGFAQLCLPGEE